MNMDTRMSGSTVKNHISFKNSIRIQCITENFVPIVGLGLSTTSSSSSTSSLTIPSKEIDHLQQSCQAKVWIDKYGKTRMGQITIAQSCQVKVWKGKYGETRILLKHQESCWINQPKPQNQIKMRILDRYGETRIIPTYRNGCKNSARSCGCKSSWTQRLTREFFPWTIFRPYEKCGFG